MPITVRRLGHFTLDSFCRAARSRHRPAWQKDNRGVSRAYRARWDGKVMKQAYKREPVGLAERLVIAGVIKACPALGQELKSQLLPPSGPQRCGRSAAIPDGKHRATGSSRQGAQAVAELVLMLDTHNPLAERAAAVFCWTQTLWPAYIVVEAVERRAL